MTPPISDPYSLGRGDILDNTPWWVSDNRRGTERSLGFCDPFGFESEDVRVMGGMNDPAHESYMWKCQNFAQGRYYMTCANGHGHDRKLIMRLCYAHVRNITTRMAGLCPACAWPPRAKELKERMDWFVARIADPATWPDERQRLASGLADAQAEMNELRDRGQITTGAPLRLEEVS